MAEIADITVKKNDGTTDIVWTGVQPSSGDGTAAIWQSQTVGSAVAHRPELRLSARDADSGSARAMRATGKYPQIATNTTTGVTSVINVADIQVNWKMPKGMAATDVNEFVSQLANLFASAAFKNYVKSGYSAS